MTEDTKGLSVKAKDILTLFVLSLIWGSSFILIKKSLLAFTFYEVAILRIAISCLAFIPFFLQVRKAVDWRKWKKYILVGMTGSGIPAFLYSAAEIHISSAIAGLLNSLTPICTLAISIFFFGEVFRWNRLIGVIVGLSGAALLMLYGKESGFGGNAWYSLFIIAGTICYGFNVNFVKAYFQDTDPIVLSAVSFLMIGSPALLYVLFSSIPHTVVSHPDGLTSIMAVSFLALLGTVFSVILFYKLVQRTNPVFASSVAYFMPIIALLWGLLDGEAVGLFHIIGLAFILVGVYIIRGKPTIKSV